ncbi:thymidine kinase, partial [Enterococcus casseliflavus]
KGKVTSRIGLSADALLFSDDMNIRDAILAENNKEPIHCVLIDECQFLTKAHVEQLCEITDSYDIPVLTYGLRTDFRGEL